MVTVCRIGADEAADSKEAGKIAKARMGPNYKMSSIQRGGAEGGWSCCFKRAPITIEAEALETFVANQARMAKAANDKAETGEPGHYIAREYQIEAEIRKDVVEELAKYLEIPDAKIQALWEAGTQ